MYRVAECLYLSGVRIHALVLFILTYLLTQLAQAYKTGNTETVEDTAKATINGHKVEH